MQLLRPFTGPLVATLVAVGSLTVPVQAQSLQAETNAHATAADAVIEIGLPIPVVMRGGGVIYDNGGLSTGPTTQSGVAAPSGYEWSEVQNETGNTTYSNTLAGAGCVGALRLADDFVVPDGETWTVTDVTAYAYQTGAGATSPINGANLRIWDGVPDDPGSTVLFGDMTTNRLTSTTEAGLFRVFNTAVPAPGTPPGTTRRIWQNVIAVSPAAVFTSGTYWIDYSFTVVTGGLFCPPITIPGVRALDGWNARQFTTTPTPGWVNLIDVGNPDAAAPDLPLDVPFLLGGTVDTGGGVTTYPSTDTPLPIPDCTGAGTCVPGAVVSTIVVPPGAGTISDLDVAFHATHSWAGDLAATVSNGITSVTFYDRPGVPGSTFGCSGDNPNIIADDEGTDGSIETGCTGTGTAPAYPVVGGRYTPNSPLSAFDGAMASGTWTLTVTDNAAGDTGSLTSWALLISSGPIVSNEGGPSAGTFRLAVAPNPITASAQATLSVDVSQDVRVSLYDVLGREVRVLFEGAVAAGQQAHIGFPTAGLPAGAYVVRASGDGVQATQRVTITR